MGMAHQRCKPMRMSFVVLWGSCLSWCKVHVARQAFSRNCRQSSHCFEHWSKLNALVHVGRGVYMTYRLWVIIYRWSFCPQLRLTTNHPRSMHGFVVNRNLSNIQLLVQRSLGPPCWRLATLDESWSFNAWIVEASFTWTLRQRNHEHQHFWIQMHMALMNHSPSSWNKAGFPPQKTHLPDVSEFDRSRRRCGGYLLGSKTHPNTLKSQPSYQTSQAKEPGAAENHGGWSRGFRKDAFPQYTIYIYSFRIMIIVEDDVKLLYLLHHCWCRITITYHQIALSFF